MENLNNNPFGLIDLATNRAASDLAASGYRINCIGIIGGLDN